MQLLVKNFGSRGQCCVRLLGASFDPLGYEAANGGNIYVDIECEAEHARRRRPRFAPRGPAHEHAVGVNRWLRRECERMISIKQIPPPSLVDLERESIHDPQPAPQRRREWVVDGRHSRGPLAYDLAMLVSVLTAAEDFIVVILRSSQKLLVLKVLLQCPVRLRWKVAAVARYALAVDTPLRCRRGGLAVPTPPCGELGHVPPSRCGSLRRGQAARVPPDLVAIGMAGQSATQVSQRNTISHL